LPVAPSAVAAPGKTFTKALERVPCEVPRALETQEIPDMVDAYVEAAVRSAKAGFDGIEIHAANGYLLDQFLHASANVREDAYGGTIENRCRLVLEIVDAIAKSGAYSPQRMAVRLSPFVPGMFDPSKGDTPAVYAYLVRQLVHRDIGIIHIVCPHKMTAPLAELGGQVVGSFGNDRVRDLLRYIRAHSRWNARSNAYATLVLCTGNFHAANAFQASREDLCDLVGFGRLYISNPGLKFRLRYNLPLREYDMSKFYMGGEEGYIDYPPWAQEKQGHAAKL